MYTFDDQLTTDQKIAHLQVWIAATEVNVQETSSGGSRAHEETHKEAAERLRMLREWERLVEVEEELAASKADIDDPDPLGDRMQEAWCRMTRLTLKVAGIHVHLRAEKAKRNPSRERIERLRARSNALFKKLFAAQEEAEGRAYRAVSHGLEEVECEGGDACTEDDPCTPCACRWAMGLPEK